MSKSKDLMKTASLKITEQDLQIKKLAEEAKALKAEIATFIAQGEKKDGEIAGYKKEAAARSLVKGMVEKGYVNPTEAEDKIASFIASAGGVNDIEKMANLVGDFQEKVVDDGELMDDKVASTKTAEDTFFAVLNK
mgnify:FL=1